MKISQVYRLCFRFGLVALLLASSVSAKSRLSFRMIGGMTQAASGAVPYENNELTPIFGFGFKYSLSSRHSLFVDVERVQRWANSYHPNESLLTDFALSREPLTEPSDAYLTLYPITLGYQLNLVKSDQGRFSPFISAGANLVRVVSDLPPSPRYPSLDVSAFEEIERTETVGQWKFGAVGGIGCAARINSWLSLSGTMSYRHVGVPSSRVYTPTGRTDIQQNVNSIVSEGSDYDRNPSIPRNGGFEGRFVLEFRL